MFDRRATKLDSMATDGEGWTCLVCGECEFLVAAIHSTEFEENEPIGSQVLVEMRETRIQVVCNNRIRPDQPLVDMRPHLFFNELETMCLSSNRHQQDLFLY